MPRLRREGTQREIGHITRTSIPLSRKNFRGYPNTNSRVVMTIEQNKFRDELIDLLIRAQAERERESFIADQIIGLFAKKHEIVVVQISACRYVVARRALDGIETQRPACVDRGNAPLYNAMGDLSNYMKAVTKVRAVKGCR